MVWPSPRSPRLRRLALVLLSLLGACAPDSSAPFDPVSDLQPVPTGAIRGELVTYVYDFQGHSETHHALRLPSGQEYSLRFATEPALTSGTTIDVWASDEDGTLRVSKFEASRPLGGEISRTSAALIAGTKKTPKRWAFVLVDTSGAGELTPAAAKTKLFGDDPASIRSYYREVSYGLQELSGDVVGPIKIDATSVPGGLCQSFQLVGQTLRPMIPGTYNQYLYFFLSPIRGCAWGGVADLGTAARPTRDSYYNAVAQCVVLVQEPGHNFGMVHSSALRCTKGGVPVSMIDPTDVNGGACQHDEYGNPFDPMGGGNPGAGQTLSTCYHMNGIQKAYQDWLESCNIVKAGTSGLYTIYPLEKACNGVQLLQIPLPAPRRLTFPPSPVATLTSGLISSYYLELRAPIGLDSGLRAPRVFVMAAGDLKDARLRGNANWLIDATPGTPTVADADLAVGATFTDPAPKGPKFTVVSADETKAVIRVQLNGQAPSDVPGNGKCADDTPFNGPGLPSCEAAPISRPPTDAGGADASDASGGDARAMGGGGMGGGPPSAGRNGGPPDAWSPRSNDSPDARRDSGKERVTAVSGHGCSCRLGGRGPGGLPLALALALPVLMRRRRRP